MDNYYSIDHVGKNILLNRTGKVLSLQNCTLAVCPDSTIALVDQIKNILIKNSVETNHNEMYSVSVATDNLEDKDSRCFRVEGVQIELTLYSEESFLQSFGPVTLVDLVLI